MPWRWRKATWALAIWNVLALVLAIVIGNVAQSNCTSVTQSDLAACQIGTGLGTSVLYTVLIVFWFIGFVVLSLVWLMSRPSKRTCPQCGHDVKKGLTECRRCGYSFLQPMRRGVRD